MEEAAKETPSAHWLKALLDRTKKTALQEAADFMQMSSEEPSGLTVQPWIQVNQAPPLRVSHLYSTRRGIPLADPVAVISPAESDPNCS